MTSDPLLLDAQLRLRIDRHFIASGRAPTLAELADASDIALTNVRAACERLATGRAVVLQKDSGEILMAEPFSAVPTAFWVQVGDRAWWANCIWDALGIPAMLDADAQVMTACGDCSEAMTLCVQHGELVHGDGVVHYAIPPHKWWTDIVFA